MRGIIIGTLGIINLLTFLPALQAQSPAVPGMADTRLKWSLAYQAALKRAEAEKKPVLIDFTTDWCGWSKKMDRETISDPAVQKLLQSFVLTRLNPEASDENEKVSEKYGVTGYPHFVIANFKGEDIGHLEGYAEKKDFVEFLQKFSKLFKDTPLGYRSVELEPSDPLLKAIQRIPPPESRPTSVGSFIVLDQSDIRLLPDGTAKFVTRLSTYIADPDKEDLPEAVRHYNSSRQKLKFKTVRVLDLKGRGREVNVAMSKDEHAYSNQNVYWDVRQLSLDLPKLKEGQILDVIEEREYQPVMPGQFYFNWNTGTHMLLASELKLTFPASLKLQKQSVRCKGEVKETQNADGTLTWTLDTSNPVPYEPMPFSPPLHEIREGYDFFTPCTQDEISRWYSGLCQGRDSLPESALRKIREIKATNTTQTTQLQAILTWVTKDIRYVSVTFGLSSHQPHSATETLVNLYGDCKDQSMLLLSLCRAAEIPAAMVLVNSHGENFNETNPAVEMFNHCIVEAKADGQRYYLDPASGETRLGRVPQSYAGTRALKIDGANGMAVTLPPFLPQADQQTDETIVKLNPNGSATITNISLLTDAAAARQRKQMKNTTPDKIRSYLQESYKRSGRKLVDFYMTDPARDGNEFLTRIGYTSPRFGSMTSGGLVFKMGAGEDDGDWISLLNLPRTRPFRFYASDIGTRKFSVELPTGTVLKARPEDLQIDTAFLKVTRKVEFTNNRLTVTEVSGYRDAHLPATAAGEVSAAFQKLQDHRDYSFIVQLPSRAQETVN